MDEYEIKSEFSKRKKYQFTVAIIAIIVICFSLYLKISGKDDEANENGTGRLMLYIMIPAILFSFYNWRCPNCKKYLGQRLNVTFCARCGSKLSDESE